uniref:Uncharacterized protein n=1 Tax=Chromera velia CCMP2878 TaxID=1169474 RepID=A0A0G4H4K5_9ALVE|eukprot:Cvel_24605.t1-p1 / transcript=Cvel_24605.t1 / gene=Cvel_24605 / organism=Chromera_velia_CCMP2878 / gene_product=hypothetical protein / transcript_product=hypothetical protein / location=Cvel_scaffold2681:9893-13088(-) / protein_length=235 / sequence_SO=supercontig / SO=protein_coding / is_pseudo=false
MEVRPAWGRALKKPKADKPNKPDKPDIVKPDKPNKPLIFSNKPGSSGETAERPIRNRSDVAALMHRADLTDGEKVNRLAEVSIQRVEGYGGDSLIGENVDDEEEEEADGDGTGSGAVVLVDDLPPKTIFMARNEMLKIVGKQISIADFRWNPQVSPQSPPSLKAISVHSSSYGCDTADSVFVQRLERLPGPDERYERMGQHYNLLKPCMKTDPNVYAALLPPTMDMNYREMVLLD